MRKRGVSSPDRADAVMMTHATPATDWAFGTAKLNPITASLGIDPADGRPLTEGFMERSW
jgi:hypothetical protein